jgi:hypothetical protein
MKKVKIYVNPHSEDGKTPTTFRFNQPDGCDKVYNSYKTLEDDYKVENIDTISVYGYDSREEMVTDVENFVSTLPKYLHKYVSASTTNNTLGENGYVEYGKSVPSMVIRVLTSHTYDENKIKKLKRLYKELLNHLNYENTTV